MQLFSISGLVRRLRPDVGGNVLVMTAVGLTTLCFAFGFIVDYSRAETVQTQLNGIADAAALAAVDPSMAFQPDANAHDAAVAMFNAQAGQFSAITGLQVDVQITHPTGAGVTSTGRNVTVGYIAQSTNIFATFIGMNSLAISGTAAANSATPANINFYVMLDQSASMLLPTTSSGITSMQSVNKNCAFACHNTFTGTMVAADQRTYQPIVDSNGYQIFLAPNYYNNGPTGAMGVYRYDPKTNKVYDGSKNLLGTNGNISTLAKASGPYADSGVLVYKPTSGVIASVQVMWADAFWLAENYGLAYDSPTKINLRIDDMLTAVNQLVTTAQNTITSYGTQGSNVTYNMQFYKLNYGAYPMTPTMANVNGINLAPLTYTNGTFPYDAKTIAPLMTQQYYWPTNSNTDFNSYTNNSDSAPNNALSQMLQNSLATPGTGVNGDKPQGIMFIITDGYQDEMINGTQVRQQWNAAAIAQCAAIKKMGIRIGILYTTYDPNTINVDQPGLATATPYILPALQSCASPNPAGGYLVNQVSTNGDISAALSALFQTTVATAYLVQ